MTLQLANLWEEDKECSLEWLPRLPAFSPFPPFLLHISSWRLILLGISLNEVLQLMSWFLKKVNVRISCLNNYLYHHESNVSPWFLICWVWYLSHLWGRLILKWLLCPGDCCYSNYNMSGYHLDMASTLEDHGCKQQEGQDGPGSLTWIFEMTIATFFFVPFWEEFIRISLCPYSASSPHSLMPCLLTDQNFANNFWKGSPKEHFYEILSKSDQWFHRRKFFKNLFMFV